MNTRTNGERDSITGDEVSVKYLVLKSVTEIKHTNSDDMNNISTVDHKLFIQNVEP